MVIEESMPNYALKAFIAIENEYYGLWRRTILQQRKGRNLREQQIQIYISPNLLNQNFKVNSPNEVWVGDITYISTYEGWLYLAVVLDLYSRKVVGWSMSNRMTSQLVIDALEHAIIELIETQLLN